MEETMTERGKSLAAPAIFILVFAFHFASKYLESYKKKKGSMTNADIQLRAEIKELLKEASSLSQPSTFAQAAKLRRMAAAKEKELAKNQETHSKDMQFDTYEKLILIAKVVTYAVLILWYWKSPVATISDQLVKPFGKLLSWRAGRSMKDYVMVGVIPWLIVSTRVSKFICRKVSDKIEDLVA
ncbi:hypothetical protein BUALT_Bualt08G0122000 [Buddleja alternifolia]|uniref:Tail-anchored protein insertion receptor WRB n=1 Tax=Buddleja alternifolia TaxID=168488 RepID=A0AAV6XDV6_9LAMI|nr:hypothetical protein BUALT_Bualt08G0122000 [Buddleja alternifolia]